MYVVVPTTARVVWVTLHVGFPCIELHGELDNIATIVPDVVFHGFSVYLITWRARQLPIVTGAGGF